MSILINHSVNIDTHDPIWKQWNPRQYLADFYDSVDADEIETIAFLTDIAQRIPKDSVVLEFGSGPTLHHIFPFAPIVSEIHMADLIESNLSEIQTWISNDPEAHHWDPFIKYALSCEGHDTSETSIATRAAETRAKITKLMTADAKQQDPLGPDARATYPVVMSCYCADSATDNHRDFEAYLSNVISLIEPGGLFILACLRNAMHYKVGPLSFPSANVNEHVVQGILENHCVPDSISISVRELPSHIDQGYTSILLSYATKK